MKAQPQPQPQPQPELQHERDTCFMHKHGEIETVTKLLYGGEAHLKKRRILREMIEKDEIFSNDSNVFLDRMSRHERAVIKAKRLIQIMKALRLESDQDKTLVFDAICDDVPIQLHTLMFIPNIRDLCSHEQVVEWLPLCTDYRIIGCYAQTELGHGSNVQALETTATYIPETDEFEIHTPSLSAAKWWPGALGQTATHAMVIARLLLPVKNSTDTNSKFKDQGLHNFIVPLRDLQTYSHLPGVETGDIGPKIGFNNMDNGYAIFNHVRVPRSHMAARYSSVDCHGVYHKHGRTHSRIAYITMLQVRVQLVLLSSIQLARASVISLRYSLVRRQGSPPKGVCICRSNACAALKGVCVTERQIIDYQTQLLRLLPLLAATYAIRFVSQELWNRLLSVEQQLQDDQAEPQASQSLSALHTDASALKSWCTNLAADGIETCRRCCGGHGYLACSGLPELYTTFLQTVTVEGDNGVLPQQCTRGLMKILASGPSEHYFFSFMDGSGNVRRPTLPQPDYEGQAFDVSTIETILGARSLCTALKVRHQLLSKDWDSCLALVTEASEAHAAYVVFHSFANQVMQVQEHGISSSLNALRCLCRLFGLCMVVKAKGDLLQHELLSPAMCDVAHEQLLQSCTALRGEVIGLVDAWDFSDFELKSALGRYDGQVYDALMRSARANPMNQNPMTHIHLLDLVQGRMESVINAPHVVEARTQLSKL